MNGNNLRENFIQNEDRIKDLRKDQVNQHLKMKIYFLIIAGLQYFPNFDQLQNNFATGAPNDNEAAAKSKESFNTLNESVWASLVIINIIFRKEI